MKYIVHTMLFFGAMAISPLIWAADSDKEYKYCLKVSFDDPKQIESATVSLYEHPWYTLFRPKEVFSATFTSHTDRHCWKSKSPQLGIGMNYVVRNSEQGTNEFRCRKTPDPMEKYQAKTWNLSIREKRRDEFWPIDCRIK